MQEHKLQQNQEGKGLNLSVYVLQFLTAHARRKGRDPVELAASLGLTSGGQGALAQLVQQSMGSQLGQRGIISYRTEGVGPPSISGVKTPLDMTVARPAEQVRDALARWRNGEAARRLAEKILARQGEAADELRAYLKAHPESATAWLFFLLYRLAVDVARERYGAHARKLGQVVFAIPMELLAEHFGVNRSTIWRALKRIEASGLIAARDWYTASTAGKDGVKATRVAAKLFAVRLRPGRARLHYDELTHHWRDLDGDRAHGRTAWAWKRHRERPSYAVLRAWALGQPVAPDESPPDVQLYDIHGLAGLLPHEAAPLVTQLADYLAKRLSDTHSRAFYAKLLWKVVHLKLRPEVLIAQIERVEADLREGWARNPGALLAHRLST